MHTKRRDIIAAPSEEERWESIYKEKAGEKVAKRIEYGGPWIRSKWVEQSSKGNFQAKTGQTKLKKTEE